MLLYPLLGMSLFQMAQFVQEQATRGAGRRATNLPRPAAAVREGALCRRGCSRTPGGATAVGVAFRRRSSAIDAGAWRTCELTPAPRCKRATTPRRCTFRPTLPSRLEAFRRAMRQHSDSGPGERSQGRHAIVDVPSPEILYNTANDKSRIAFDGINEALRQWTQRVARREPGAKRRFAAGGVPVLGRRAATWPTRSAAAARMWSKMLPVLLLLWALTGAFYPAVDLCAGEKERGTLGNAAEQPGRAQRNRRRASC